MFEPMPHYRMHLYNTNNYHKVAPFIFKDNNLIVQPSFYNKIKDTWVEQELKKQFDSIIIEEGVLFGKVPETDDISEDEYNRFFIVYKIFLRWYDSDKWCHVLDRPHAIISYNKNEKEMLINISKRMIVGGTQRLNDQNKSDLDILIKKIDEGVKKCNKGDGCFVKMSGASTKHDYAPHAINDGVDCLEHLLGSKRVYKNLDCNNIFIQPWRNDVKLNGEFRVFVEDDKVIGISQQALDQIYQECINVYRIIYKDIIKMAQDIWDSITDKLEYSEATLDVWMDPNNKMYLIELNTYGIWQAAGSSWFNWENDFPKASDIKSLDDVPFRITYPNSYYGLPNNM
jgi:hypothetical protein